MTAEAWRPAGYLAICWSIQFSFAGVKAKEAGWTGSLIYILINLALGWFSHWLERKLRTRRGGGKVVQIDPAAQSDLMAARQQIEILDAPGIDEFKKS